jgi:2-dehydropantoate 2-reductase
MRARVLVAGAGAVGSVFGGFLRQAGHAVTLLGRAGHLDAIARNGLRLDGLFGEALVRDLALATDAATLAPGFDAVLLTVKSFDTDAAIAAAAPLLADDGCMLALQNGLGNVERVAAAVGPRRAAGARVIFGATRPEPGRAHVTVCAEPVAVGVAVPGDLDAERHARAWAEAFAAAGIPTVHTDDLQAHLWTKVFYNAALNPLGALHGLPYGALAADADARAIMDSVIDEGYAVAGACGVRPLAPDAAAYRQIFYERLVPPTADHRSSMLQDLEQGRRTEIDAINGRIWEYGRARGVPTPVNEVLTRLVRWRERLARGKEAS